MVIYVGLVHFQCFYEKCDAYKELRNDNKELLEANPSVKDLLNPKDKDTAYKLGCFLKQIEERRQSLVERHSG